MGEVRIVPLENMGFDFVPGKDDFRRPWPFGTSERDWRPLTEDEIAALTAQGNRADSWENIRVTDGFSSKLVRDCRFYGPVRIAALRPVCLEQNDLRLPVGLYSSTIVACDIGNDVAVHRVAFMAHMRIEERCVLFNVDEMVTTNHAKFGNGVVMDGEEEKVRIWLEIANENGGRKVLPFDGMLPADAWIWSKYRDDAVLMDRFIDMTGKAHPPVLGIYGVVGSGSVVKDSRILKDVKIGPSAYIKGCNKLKNLTINSDGRRPTQIGEGCELVNGIVGYGCRIFYGVKAVRFILNDHSALKYGARLINSILGPNSTISCCEVLNSLLFGSHEQHHNSSFLCASVMKGMSNMASAATVGSNHNSRAADGEIVADRGFWPGLSASLKHNSRFAAFCLIAKGAYPAELHVPLPFCLVSNDENAGELKLMPGYWFRYNMYALARNAVKTASRDRRTGECQELEYDWLAPDTVDQMLQGRRILTDWADLSASVAAGEFPDGRTLLETRENPELFAQGRFSVESGRRPVRILHAGRCWLDYGRMLRFYAVRILLTAGGVDAVRRALLNPGHPQTDSKGDPWLNVGGQLMRESALEGIKTRIKNRSIHDWPGVHRAYRHVAGEYRERRLHHAVEVLTASAPEDAAAESLLDDALETARFIFRGIRESRRKDYENQFRNSVYDSPAERDAVLGRFEENAFVTEAGKDLERFESLVEKSRLSST